MERISPGGIPASALRCCCAFSIVATASNLAWMISGTTRQSWRQACFHADNGAADRRGVVAVGVEGRVQIDEVNRRGVEAAQDIQVVPGPNRSIGEISRHTHARLTIVLGDFATPTFEEQTQYAPKRR